MEVLSYAQHYNDDGLIVSELEKGRKIFEGRKNNDYDAVALCLLRMAAEKAAEGKTKEAVFLIADMFATMISDEHLIGVLQSAPIVSGDSLSANMLNAVFSLYGGNYEDGVAYAERIIRRRQCKEALFVKSRCLAMLGRYGEAAAVNVELIKLMDKDVDVKILFAVSTVNEAIGEPGLGIMQCVIKIFLRYTPAILKLRAMMRAKGRKLEAEAADSLVDAFNGSADADAFAAVLTEADNGQRDDLINIILKQAF